MNCNEAVAALIASLETGTPMTEAQRAHVQSCPKCRELMESAKQVLADAETPSVAPAVSPIDEAVAAAEAQVLRNRMRRIVWVIAGVATIIASGIALMLLPFEEAGSYGFWLYAAGMGALISAGFAVPVLLMIYLLRDSARRRIYKRFKPGRVIDGVCLGMAEKFNLDVTLVRLVFIALVVLAGGLGIWFYVALDVAMPVHPDDRQYLRRFRLRRWWARRTGHAEHHAG